MLTNEQTSLLHDAVNRIRTMEQEKADIAEDIRVEWQELKRKGFDIKLVKEALRRHQLSGEQDIIDEYTQALGLTPLEKRDRGCGMNQTNHIHGLTHV